MSLITLIAGVASDGAIGRNNELLWRLPEDLAHFKALTLGHAVIMGRKTWESIPERFRPLPGRRNIVLSRQPGLQLAGAEVLPTLQEALAACATDDQVFIIGGAQIYAAALPQAQRLELTEVEAAFADADAHFPAWDRQAFKQVSRASHQNAAGLAFHFTRYERQDTHKDL
ncbi:dihydrofolate reductase [Pelomonas sp. SE-A7]|uniref:dihydrofolate reductase n=1 Tax=Pelomonas sp. SE-A7 TaxID=3054953 RepID=UPI00259CFB81|nr:dihydrofolate reductase [Pelomonas sp. SE-A7]MDM4765128.1 dihydrofolate reductase [Pelomonas sp. SE-A7]